MDTKAAKAISTAKTDMVLNHPFFSMLLLRLKIEENNSVPTMCTDGVHILYNANFVNNLTSQELKGVLIHEVYHITLLHPLRLGDRDHFIFNVAGDYAINYLVTQAGFTLPQDVLLDSKYNNMETEAIYNDLMKDAKKIKIQLEGSGSMIGEFGSPKDGSGNDVSETEKKIIEAGILEGLQAAYNVAKKQGFLPNGIERLVKKILDTHVNWRDALQEFMNIFAKNDYCWTRPNRKSINPFIRPSLTSIEIGDFVTAIDTSGSMNDEELGEVAGEHQAILSTFNANLFVIYCDSAVHGDIQEFSGNDNVELEMRGGGGTDYRPVFKKVDEEGLDPVCLIYFTDGECDSFPRHEPGYPVLWVITNKYDIDFQPPFGRVVRMHRKF